MTSAIVNGPHHDAQQLFLSQWDFLWYMWKKYENWEYFHNIDDQGLKIDDGKKYFDVKQTCIILGPGPGVDASQAGNGLCH